MPRAVASAIVPIWQAGVTEVADQSFGVIEAAQ